MDFTERVLVLKVGRFREADIWLRTLSPTRGVITAFAFGGCRSKKRFCGCLDALNVVEFAFKPSRCGEYLSVAEGELITGPQRLRKDCDRLGMAVNCLKFLEALQYDRQGASIAYSLALDALDVLETMDAAMPAFPLLFRARVAFALGYEPSLGACGSCGTVLDSMASPRFLLEQGQVECETCQSTRGRYAGMPVSHGALKTLEAVGQSMPSQWPNLRLEPNVLKECSRAVDGFVQYHLGLTWDRGFFKRV